NDAHLACGYRIIATVFLSRSDFCSSYPDSATAHDRACRDEREIIPELLLQSSTKSTSVRFAFANFRFHPLGKRCHSPRPQVLATARTHRDSTGFALAIAGNQQIRDSGNGVLANFVPDFLVTQVITDPYIGRQMF